MAEKARSIFEEVGEGARPAAPTGGLIGQRGGARRGVRLWLVLIFVLVAAMVLVGGLTRLTDSGLSITEWKPITGAIPPMSTADWTAEFQKYQQSPQYELMNRGMTLGEFQFIYWWEWGHRQLGRLIGLVWGLGFLGFWLSGRIPPGWTRRLLLLGVLGGLQGAIGWWMVSSGLTGRMVSVASYRLATHLGIAFVILGVTGWFILSLGRSEAALLQARRMREARLFGLGTGLMHLGFLQILLGALVAGIDAGRAFPTWPLMNGHFFPEDAFYVPHGPWYLAFFENPGLVQFIHRMSGYLLVALGLAAWAAARRSAHATTRSAFAAVAVMLIVQMTLGIFTALYAAPLHIAIVHQAGAILVWALILRARHRAQYPIAGSIRKGTA